MPSNTAATITISTTASQTNHGRDVSVDCTDFALVGAAASIVEDGDTPITTSDAGLAVAAGVTMGTGVAVGSTVGFTVGSGAGVGAGVGAAVDFGVETGVGAGVGSGGDAGR